MRKAGIHTARRDPKCLRANVEAGDSSIALDWSRFMFGQVTELVRENSHGKGVSAIPRPQNVHTYL